MSNPLGHEGLAGEGGRSAGGRSRLSFATNRLATVVLGCFVTAAILLFVYVSASTLFEPIGRSQFDIYWARAIAGVCLVIGVLVLPYRGRLLGAASLLAVGGFVVITIIAAKTGPSLAVLLWLMVVCLAMGDRALRLLASDADPTLMERCLFGVALGLGIMMLLTFGIAVLKVLYAWVIYAVLTLLTIALAPDIRVLSKTLFNAQILRRIKSAGSDERLFWFLVGCCALSFLAGFVWAVAPETHYDPLNYQLGIPEVYVQQHGLVEIPYSFWSYFVAGPGMLYTLALCVVGQPLPQLIHFSVGLMLAAMTFVFARRFFSARVGLLSAALVYTLPLVTLESGTVNTDLFACLYSLGAVYAVVVWIRGGRNGWLVIAGLMSGFAIASKFNAVVALIPSCALLVYALLRRSLSWGQRARALFISFAAPAVAVSAPWFVTRYVWTGNPVFPFLNAIFRSPDWPSVNESLNFHLYGKGSGLYALVMLPWDLAVNTSRFIEGPDGVLGVTTILAAPLFLLLAGKKGLRRAGPVLIVAVGGTLIWFKLAHQARYFLPLVPIAVCLAALNLETVYQRMTTLGASRRRVAVAAAALGLMYLAAVGMVSIGANRWNAAERYPYRVALGLESGQKFLSRTVGAYDALVFLDRLEGNPPKVLSVGNEFRLYTRAQIESMNGSQHALALVRTADIRTLVAKLGAEGYTHLLVNRTDVNNQRPAFKSVPLLSADFLSRYARLEFARNGFEVYQFISREPPNDVGEAANLLNNSGFERLTVKGSPAGWLAYGAPAVDAGGKKSHSGKTAVLATKSAGVYAMVPVEPGQVYTLAHWTRADRPDQFARLQINWLAKNLQPGDVSIKVVAVGEDWVWSGLAVTAPVGAVFAQVYASVHDDGAVWFDDFVFAKGTLNGPR